MAQRALLRKIIRIMKDEIEYNGRYREAVRALAPIAIRICREYYDAQKAGMNAPTAHYPDKTSIYDHKTLTIISSMHSAFNSEQFREGEHQAHRLYKHLNEGGVATLLLNFFESCKYVDALQDPKN